MEPQIQKLLSGGLDLLPAGDAIKPGECVALQNWRMDQPSGMLRSRLGHTLIQTVGGNIHSIRSVPFVAGVHRYYGSGVDLFREGANIGSFYDGNPLGLASFDDRLWIMNRSAQQKDDGTNNYGWTPTAPGAAPTLAYFTGPAAPTYVAGGHATGQLSGPQTYVVTGIIPGIGEVVVSAQLVTTSDHGAGGSPPAPFGVPSPFWSGWLDLESAVITPPTFADPAITQWNLYRMAPFITTGVANGLTPAYIQAFYLVNSAPIAIASTYTDTAEDLTGMSGDNQTYDFVGTRGRTYVAGLGSTGSVPYSYYATGDTALAEETNPSPALTIDLAYVDGVTLTAPAFTDPQITTWNVYRYGGPNPTQPYLVNPTPIPVATTTYIDTGKDNTPYGGTDQSDTGLLNLGVQMPTNHDPAPPAAGVVGPYNQKLLAFSTAAHPNRLFWTESDTPWFFPGSNSDQDGNWVDIGESGEAITGVAVFPNWVAILKGKTIYRMVGDPDDWGSDIERTNSEVGQMGPQAFTVTGASVMGQAEEYLFDFNGDRAQKITLTLDPIFKGDGVPNTVGAIPSAAIDSGARATACMAYRNGRLYYTCGALTLVGSAQQEGRWGTDPQSLTPVYEGRWGTDTREFTALFDEGQGGYLLGAIGGSVYALEQEDTDAGAAIPLIYQSRYEDQGSPENEKRYSDILIEHNTGGHTLTVTAYLGNGVETVELGTITSSSRTQTTFTLEDMEYRNIAIRLASTDVGSGHAEIYTLAVHYLVLERNASTYDTGKLTLDELSLLNALELDLEIISGTVTYTLYAGTSSMPEVETAAATGTFDVSLIEVTGAVQAWWVRLILSGENFRCHSAKLQYQPIGAALYPRAPEVMPLLPQPGESQPGIFLNCRTYDTGKVVLDKVSLLNTLEVDLEIISGAVSWELYSGITSLSALDSGTFDGLEETYTAALPDGTEARWVRLVLTGDNFRCHGARLRLLPYGCYLVGVDDVFRSGDLTFGSPRVKLLQQIRVDCDPDGSITGEFIPETTAPGTTETLTLTATDGRGWQRLNFPMNLSGHVSRVEFTGSSVLRLYAIQVRAKVLGEPGEGWRWLDVPVPPTPQEFSWMELPIK